MIAGAFPASIRISALREYVLVLADVTFTCNVLLLEEIVIQEALLVAFQLDALVEIVTFFVPVSVEL